MSLRFPAKAIIFVFVLALAAMYQETPAQKKQPKKQSTPAVEAKAVAPTIEYTVSMSRPWTHLLEVQMHVSWSQMPDSTELKMPVWTPGSYLIREYERQVQNFAVKDAGGLPLRLPLPQAARATASPAANPTIPTTRPFRTPCLQMCHRSHGSAERTAPTATEGRFPERIVPKSLPAKVTGT